MLTKQEVFDKVVERLMDGTGKATEAVYEHGEHVGSACSYLNEDGNKCAVGIFLPDNEEMQSFEGPVSCLINKFKDHPDFPKEIVEYKFLMDELQLVHDRDKCWDNNEFISTNLLKRVAVKCSLKYKEEV